MCNRLAIFTVVVLSTLVSDLCLAVPTLTVTKGGTYANDYLDVNGNWVWNLQISNSDPLPVGGASLIAHLGFTATTGSPLIGASNLSTGPGDDFDTIVGLPQIFGWEIPGIYGYPVGLQTNCAAGCTVTGTANQVFAALKSINFETVGPHDFIQIITKGPRSESSQTRNSFLNVSGAYAFQGRISETEVNGPTTHYDIFSGVFGRTPGGGDANLDGRTDILDVNVVLTNWNKSGTVWYHGNFNSDSDNYVDIIDLGQVLTRWNDVNSVEDSSGFGTSAVPEPTSCALVLYGFSVLITLKRPRRKK